MTAQLIYLILTERKAGLNDDEMAVHKHAQLYTPSGELVVELCDYSECETLEPPEGF